MTTLGKRLADAANKIKTAAGPLWSAAVRWITAVLPHAMGKAAHMGYVLCYAVGVRTLLTGRRIGRALGRLFRPTGPSGIPGRG